MLFMCIVSIVWVLSVVMLTDGLRNDKNFWTKFQIGIVIVASVVGFVGAFNDSELVLATYAIMIAIASVFLTMTVAQEYRYVKSQRDIFDEEVSWEDKVKLGFILILLWFPFVLSGMLVCLIMNGNHKKSLGEEPEVDRND